MSAARDVRRRWRFRALTAVVDWSLYRMALLANRDGDRHELHHIDVQMAAGETSECGPDCPLRHAKGRIRWSPPAPSEEVPGEH